MPGVTTAYQTGVHGSRPAAGSGCILYSCTTHSLVYRSDGTSWTTWLTVGTSTSTVATDTIWDAAGDLVQGTGADTAAKLSAGTAGKFLTAAGAGVANAWGQGPLTTTGDLMLGATGGTPTRLASGGSGTLLTGAGVGSAPTWAAPAAATALTSAAADSSADVTLTADTIADATGVSVSLVAGTWFIWAEMTFSATTATYDYCLVDITDSSNVVVGEARGQVASNSPIAYCCFAQVAPGSTTTYKIRGQSGRTGNKILRYGQSTNIGTRMLALRVA